MTKYNLNVRTVFISDVHLGTVDCKAEEVNHFLKHVQCEKLVLNGDIVDGWQLKRGGKWTKEHTKFVRLILKKVEKKDTHVVYLRGNHDDFLRSFLPFELTNLELVEDHIHVGLYENFLVLHGDVFDNVTKNFVWLAHVGDFGYGLLLKLNRFYNAWRKWRGKEYFSLSKVIKAKVKEAVSHLSNFEEHIASLAKARNCSGVICGHIHTPAIKFDQGPEGIHYLNSGDWVESLTAIVEHHDGRFELIEFSDFVKLCPMEKELK